jgi:hypothetical protein
MTVWIPAELRRSIRIAAAVTEQGISELVRKALEEYLAKHKPPTPR